MKKSFLSITLLVISISMVMMFLFGATVNAQPTQFIYNTNGNSKTVYKLTDKQTLIPVSKYEVTKDEVGNITSKKVFKWDVYSKKFKPNYILKFEREGNELTTIQAYWNSSKKTFDKKVKKTVSKIFPENDVLTSESYNWNKNTDEWEIDVENSLNISDSII